MRKLRVAKRPHRSPPRREVPINGPHGVYLPDNLQLVRLIAMRGASDEEIESVYGLGSGTIKKWKQAYPGLEKAITEGRTRADGEVLCSLYKTAIGYHEYEEQAVGGKDPMVLKVKRYFPGQFLAQKHWLANRKREEWPAKETVEHTGKNGEAIKVESRNDLIDGILKIIASKVDPEKAPEKRENRAT